MRLYPLLLITFLATNNATPVFLEVDSNQARVGTSYRIPHIPIPELTEAQQRVYNSIRIQCPSTLYCLTQHAERQQTITFDYIPASQLVITPNDLQELPAVISYITQQIKTYKKRTFKLYAACIGSVVAGFVLLPLSDLPIHYVEDKYGRFTLISYLTRLACGSAGVFGSATVIILSPLATKMAYDDLQEMISRYENELKKAEEILVVLTQHTN